MGVYVSGLHTLSYGTLRWEPVTLYLGLPIYKGKGRGLFQGVYEKYSEGSPGCVQVVEQWVSRPITLVCETITEKETGESGVERR